MSRLSVSLTWSRWILFVSLWGKVKLSPLSGWVNWQKFPRLQSQSWPRGEAKQPSGWSACRWEAEVKLTFEGNTCKAFETGGKSCNAEAKQQLRLTSSGPGWSNHNLSLDLSEKPATRGPEGGAQVNTGATSGSLLRLGPAAVLAHQRHGLSASANSPLDALVLMFKKQCFSQSVINKAEWGTTKIEPESLYFSNVKF